MHQKNKGENESEHTHTHTHTQPQKNFIETPQRCKWINGLYDGYTEILAKRAQYAGPNVIKMAFYLQSVRVAKRLIENWILLDREPTTAINMWILRLAVAWQYYVYTCRPPKIDTNKLKCGWCISSPNDIFFFFYTFFVCRFFHSLSAACTCMVHHHHHSRCIAEYSTSEHAQTI